MAGFNRYEILRHSTDDAFPRLISNLPPEIKKKNMWKKDALI
jgi:hypothetical protein